MLYFQTWKIVVICAICLFGVIFTIPNLLSPQLLEYMPSFLQKQISLGLDLRGGSYLLYRVDMSAPLHDRLNNVVDSIRTAFRANKIGYKGGLNVEGDHIAFVLSDPEQLDLVRKLVKDADPELVLTAGPESATGENATPATQPTEAGQVKLSYSEQALDNRRRQAVDQAIEIVRRRIDSTGVKEPTIQREGRDRILVQVPGIDDPEHLKKVIGTTAKLTFQLVDLSVTPEEAQQGKLPPGDEVLPLEPDARQGGRGGSMVVRRHIEVGGDTLIDAQPGPQESGWGVNFVFDTVGARRFAQTTQDNVGKPFAIVLDNKIISAPVIREPILGGKGVITGNFTVQSATDLALLLRAGALPAPMTILEERTVGPGLGADSIRAGTTACFVGVGLVVVFMVLFYGLFGIFADIALFFNGMILIGSLTLLGATLTLPGIAGIALTMGMAVDANVLIYERIREEIRSGRTMLSALDAGFKRAFGTILDSHVTTLVAGALLYELGSGPVKGFAVTLSVGVIISLFSAILVTRLQIVLWLHRVKPKAIPL
jgi:preprotein translocase subunit SecD